MVRQIIICILLSFTFSVFISNVNAQDTIPIKFDKSKADSIESKKFHSPTKATLFSAVLPGLGQIYNRKYWKLPILYTGLGALTYFIIDNNNEYVKFKNEYSARLSSDSLAMDPAYNLYSDNNIITRKDYFRRSRDLLVIITGIVYLINIIDATVDAHLYDFDISEDISFRLLPNVQNSFVDKRKSYSLGLKFTLKF